MTRKDYDLIAACLGQALKYADSLAKTNAIYDVKCRLSLELSLANPRFSEEKFLSRIQYWSEQ